MPAATTVVVWMLVYAGGAPGDQHDEILSAFTTRRQAQAMLNQLKRENEYQHQFTEIVSVRAYTTVKKFLAAERQRGRR